MRQILTSNPSSGASANPLGTVGLWLPQLHGVVPDNATSVLGTANNQEFAIQFISPVSIALGHVSIVVGTGLAGAKFGIAVYDVTGNTVLARADAIDVSASGVKRVALNVTLNLQANVAYWIGWTITSSITVTLDNTLMASNFSSLQNQAVIRCGLCSTLAAGGICNSTIGTVTNSQIRIPSMFFEN